ncbi:tetratricopeptide repeat protein [Leptospira sp. 96542]|nr:tetratricopeptide repeat protein [Leptospira sp. 96542]
MFQAIKNHHTTFFLLLFSLVWQIPIHPDDRKQNCSTLGKGVPNEFLLSRGIREQVEAFHLAQRRKLEEAKSSFTKSVSFLDSYHSCLKENGLSPSRLSAETQSLNYLELGNFAEAWNWSVLAENHGQGVSRDLVLLQTRIRIRQGELTRASEVLETALPVYPNDPDFLYLLGNLYFEQKIWNKSILYYTALSFNIERRDSNSKYKNLVNRSLGELNYKLDYPKIAIKHYNDYINFLPNDTEVLFRMAQIYFVMGEFKHCRLYLEKIREKNPRDLDASFMLAEVYFMDARSFAPIFFDTLKKENKIPKEGIIPLLYKLVLGNTKGLEPKLIEFMKANPGRLSPKLALLEVMEKSESPDYLKLLVETSQYAYEYRQFSNAEKILKKGLTHLQKQSGTEEEQTLILEKISTCQEIQLKLNNAILSMKQAKLLTKDNEKLTRIQFRLAYLYLQPTIKREKEAIRVLTKLIKTSPNASQYYIRGLAYYQIEDYKSSVADFSKSIELDPNNFNFYFYRAMAQDKLKNFIATEDDLKRTIEMNEKASNAMNYLGYLYAEKNIKQEAADDLLRKAVELEPDNAAFQDSLGWVQFRKNNLERALLHLNFAASLSLERDLEDPVIYEHLGDVYLAKKDKVNAVTFYKLSAAKLGSKPNLELNEKIVKLEKEINQ